ncbi:MAG TPA: hypothetical protein P5186_02515 [Candidatus Paceibacterota bacterium]|nr:hypothetical protein [Verrucomicrobiota bacterium]HRY46896.1 hypothetical protein [Candidatus Paceibacterota bacterium]HSA01053.1 hypothetical protein [Candidatus Paceibacterota bacterium]
MDTSRAGQRAKFVVDRLPSKGLFAGTEWRIATAPYRLEPAQIEELRDLGRMLLQFYRGADLLYRQSVAGKEPPWISRWLDLGKPSELLAQARHPAFRQEIPRVIRPDLLLTDAGLKLVELDSVPGGIGLTAWLNEAYSKLIQHEKAINQITPESPQPNPLQTEAAAEEIIGGDRGMLEGFAGIFGDASPVRIVVSAEAGMYRPEMEWLAGQLDPSRFRVEDGSPFPCEKGAAVYRFFELFDLANIPCAAGVLDAAQNGRIRLTPPPKTWLEEKMLLALLWNKNLSGFWHRELGARFFSRLTQIVPQSWLLDPSPLPPHAAIPGLDLTDWRQLKVLSQRQRELILKISGFSELAWGSRGVHFGGDLSQADWAAAVDHALESFPRSPYVLQRYHKPKAVRVEWFDPGDSRVHPLEGRVRLCPYYFLTGEREAMRAKLGGVLATICPSDKKIIHGMKEAVLAPCAA